MRPDSSHDETISRSTSTRVDPPAFDPGSMWTALSSTPGVGISVTDAEGRLLFVNDTTMVLFSETTGIDYAGKRISDFHPPEFVKERLAMIARVLQEDRPLAVNHIYHGRRIESTVWPIRDRRPPCNRAIVVSHLQTADSCSLEIGTVETFSSHFIDLGPLDVLSRRELEVLVMLGHGLSVPATAKALYRSPNTIQRHKASICQKLQVSGQAEIVSIVKFAGLEISDLGLKRLRK